MTQIEYFKRIIDRLNEMKRGVLGLNADTLIELDSFFREQILNTPDLNKRERGIVIEYYLKSA